ncbi:MAG: hypothetical protein HOW73_47770 [Polyangiaceae bacterium]|nr:hypothetical protein [Polyangiaceae bacterium]
MSQAALFQLEPTFDGRVEDDFYETPAWCVGSLVEAADLRLTGRRVLDPSAGKGAILDAAIRLGARGGVGYEFDADRAAIAFSKGHQVQQADALLVRWMEADVMIGNPPFELALEFALRAAEWADEFMRPAALLLRLGFMASQSRASFHVEYPSDAHILAQRPKFRTDTNGTDKYDVAWFVWGPGQRGRWTVIPAKDGGPC